MKQTALSPTLGGNEESSSTNVGEVNAVLLDQLVTSLQQSAVSQASLEQQLESAQRDVAHYKQGFMQRAMEARELRRQLDSVQASSAEAERSAKHLRLSNAALQNKLDEALAAMKAQQQKATEQRGHLEEKKIIVESSYARLKEQLNQQLQTMDQGVRMALQCKREVSTFKSALQALKETVKTPLCQQLDALGGAISAVFERQKANADVSLDIKKLYAKSQETERLAGLRLQQLENEHRVLQEELARLQAQQAGSQALLEQKQKKLVEVGEQLGQKTRLFEALAVRLAEAEAQERIQANLTEELQQKLEKERENAGKLTNQLSEKQIELERQFEEMEQTKKVVALLRQEMESQARDFGEKEAAFEQERARYEEHTSGLQQEALERETLLGISQRELARLAVRLDETQTALQSSACHADAAKEEGRLEPEDLEDFDIHKSLSVPSALKRSPVKASVITITQPDPVPEKPSLQPASDAEQQENNNVKLRKMRKEIEQFVKQSQKQVADMQSQLKESVEETAALKQVVAQLQLENAALKTKLTELGPREPSDTCCIDQSDEASTQHLEEGGLAPLVFPKQLRDSPATLETLLKPAFGKMDTKVFEALKQRVTEYVSAQLADRVQHMQQNVAHAETTFNELVEVLGGPEQLKAPQAAPEIAQLKAQLASMQLELERVRAKSKEDVTSLQTLCGHLEARAALLEEESQNYATMAQTLGFQLIELNFLNSVLRNEGLGPLIELRRNAGTLKARTLFKLQQLRAVMARQAKPAKQEIEETCGEGNTEPQGNGITCNDEPPVGEESSSESGSFDMDAECQKVYALISGARGSLGASGALDASFRGDGNMESPVRSSKPLRTQNSLNSQK